VTPEELQAALDPLARALVGISLSDPAAARAEAQRRAPFDGELVTTVRAVAEAGAKAGWLLPKQNGAIRFGRVAKALHGFSVDAVLMSSPGPQHRHPGGELDLCFTTKGDARFDGQPEGWVVYGPMSVHVPTVSGGEMLILYFLPGGQIEFM
jgi:hypothetical protein